MRFFSLAVATAAALVSQTLATPIIAGPAPLAARTASAPAAPATARPGTKENLIMNKFNTLNDTAPGIQAAVVSAAATGFKIALHNNLGTTTANAFITARDPNGAAVILKSDGTWYRPNPNGSKTPVVIDAAAAGIRIPIGAGSVEITLPSAATSGRVYVAEGDIQFYTLLDGDNVMQIVEPSFANLQDPNAGIRWGFVEFSYTTDGSIWANLSFVDFIGTLFSIGITLGDGSTQTVQGLQAGAMDQICAGLVAQAAKDGQPWDKMCITEKGTGKTLRILSPNIFVDNDKTQMLNYYSDYINQVYTKYASQDLILRTAPYGDVHCRVSNNVLNCPNDPVGFPKPAVLDIWGCNTGPFANVGNAVHEVLRPIVCAAFTRTTLLLAGGDIQPSLPESSYYLNNPTSHYARLVHQYEVGGRGYAFSFDDVNPGGSVDQSGLLTGANAQRLDVYVGGVAGGGTTTTTTTTKAASTTMVTSTKTTTTSTTTTTTAVVTPSSVAGTVPQWGQCGGNGYTGDTHCVAPYTCVALSEWWSQCE
ncbi:hypothetical protein GQ53DRAFT_746011 [Thozetella sp. PMI_491]|nr:hypothetical protein GQ53DRAFT_746011 [Thozetella sp. PMI_491]